MLSADRYPEVVQPQHHHANNRGVICLQVHAAHLHGTGTPLGDPIEMGAIQAVLLAKGRGEASPLSLAAHKSSAGHAEAGAGLVGLACATLALEAAQTPSILHLR